LKVKKIQLKEAHLNININKLTKFIECENWIKLFDPNNIDIFFQTFLLKIGESINNAAYTLVQIKTCLKKLKKK